MVLGSGETSALIIFQFYSASQGNKSGIVNRNLCMAAKKQLDFMVKKSC
jgi:hypothetical protein